jgi:AcrR family transcriptional regulator
MSKKLHAAAVAHFHRARKPEQIAVRREAILAAAAELFDAHGPEGAGLNAIAAHAGFTKSNVYRYFESREAVLLSLFVEAFEAAIRDLEGELQRAKIGDVPTVARIFSQTIIRHPRFCRLLSILGTVLEQNVSEAVIVDMKRTTNALAGGAALALHNVLPDISVEDCGWVAATIATLVGGMWPNAQPSPAAARVMQMPEFAAMRRSVDRDLERAILIMLRGIAKT